MDRENIDRDRKSKICFPSKHIESVLKTRHSNNIWKFENINNICLQRENNIELSDIGVSLVITVRTPWHLLLLDCLAWAPAQKWAGVRWSYSARRNVTPQNTFLYKRSIIFKTKNGICNHKRKPAFTPKLTSDHETTKLKLNHIFMGVYSSAKRKARLVKRSWI